MTANRTIKLLLQSLIVFGYFQNVYCQEVEAWTMEVSVTHNNVYDCGTGYYYGGTNTSVTFASTTHNSGSGEDAFSAFFTDDDGEISGPISITSSRLCKCMISSVCADNTISVTGTIAVNHSPSDQNCGVISQTLTSGSESLSVTIIFFKTIVQPTLNSPTGVCANSNITLSTTSTASSAGYIWYVTEGGIDHVITEKTTQTIAVIANDLLRPGFTTQTRQVKVQDAGCGYPSAPSNPFIIYSAPPSATVVWTEPTCFGSDDGQVTISGVTGQVSNYLFKLYYFESTTSSFSPSIYQLSFASTALPITIKKNDIIGYGGLPFGIKAGLWRWEIENNTSPSTLGTCSISEDKTIGQPPKLDVAVSGSDYNGKGVRCYGESNGSVSASVSGGTPGYTYAWSSGSTGASISGLPAGSYTLTVTDSKGCTNTGTANLVAPDPLTVNITSTKIPSCAETADGQLTANASGGVAAYSYLWSNNQTNALATGLVKGSYSVTVKDQNNCAASSNAILAGPEPILVTLNASSPQCPGGDDGRAWVTDVQNEPGALSYQWSSGDISYEALNLSEGTYTVTVSSLNAGAVCTGKASKTIVDPAPWTANISALAQYNGAAIKCNGEANGKLDVTLRNDLNQIVSGDFYLWSNGVSGVSEKSIDDVGEGNYSVTIRYKANCEITTSFTLNDPDPVSAIILPSSNYNGVAITCPGASDGSLHATGTGGTGSAYSFLWDSGVVGPNLAGKPAGTYAVVVTDINACTGTVTGMLNDPSPINPTINVVTNYNGLPVTCHNSSDGILHASALGGAGAIAFVWNGTTEGPDLKDVGAGDYTLTATDANNCSMSASKTIINPEPVLASVEIISEFHGQAISCFNAADGSLRASAVGGTNSYTYSWSTGASGNILTGIGVGLYNVTVVDMNGCMDTETQTLINPAPVQAIITNFSDYNGFGVSCKSSQDGFIEASGQGGTGSFSYLWLETMETTPNVSNLMAGIYKVRVTDANGCSDTKSHHIIEPMLLSIDLTNRKNILCFDGNDGALNVTAGGGLGGYQYSLNPTNIWQVSSSFTGLKAEVPYTVTVKDLNNCTAALTEILTQPAKLAATFETQPAFCSDARGAAIATVTGGTGAFIYEWKDPSAMIISNASSITNKPAGVYSLTVRDGNNCALAESVGIVSTDGPQVHVIETIAAKCSYSADGGATLEPVSGDTPFRYLWPNGQKTSQATGFAQGFYNVTVTDKNECVTVKQVEIPAPLPLAIELVERIDPVCFGDCNGKLKVATTGGTGPYSYVWNNQPNDEEVTLLCDGTHSVEVTDAHHCTTNTKYTLTQPASLQLQVKDRRLPLCNGDCNGSLEVIASGGNGDYSYDWNSSSKEAVAMNLCAGSHTVKLSDRKNCSLERTILLGEPDPLQVRLIRNQSPVCHDACTGALEIVAFGGTGEFKYHWDNGVATTRMENICPKEYRAQVTDENQCKLTQSYTVENPPALAIDLGEDKTLCEGQTHVLDAGPSWTSYKWGSNVGATGTTDQILVKDAGMYWIEVENQSSCIARDTFMLATSLDLLQAEFFMTSKAVVGDTIVIVDVSWPMPDNIAWRYPEMMVKIFDNGPVLYGKFNDAGVYEIMLNASLGHCRDSLVKTISIEEHVVDPEGGRLGYREFVSLFELFPNPNTGVFDVNIDLAEVSPITLSIWNQTTFRNLGTWKDSGESKYQKHIDLHPLGSGIYILRLDYPTGSKSIKFIVH